jgi:hypothetical protein
MVKDSPNPVKGLLNLEFGEELTKNKVIDMQDITGKSIIQNIC